MGNRLIDERLRGIQEILKGVHQAGAGTSSATKGTEREQFVSCFLSQVFPAPFRFGSGDATDQNGHRTGQLDVVVEYPFLPSLPVPGTSSTRLYLAEGIAAVIEVKSSVDQGWQEVLRTAKSLALLERSFGGTFSMAPGDEIPMPPSKSVPFFAVGYTGWKNLETAVQKLAEGPVDGILVIDDPGIFVSKKEFGEMSLTGPRSLWGLIWCLQKATSTLKAMSVELMKYYEQR